MAFPTILSVPPDTGASVGGVVCDGCVEVGWVDVGCVDVGWVDVGCVEVGCTEVGSVDVYSGSPQLETNSTGIRTSSRGNKQIFFIANITSLIHSRQYGISLSGHLSPPFT